MTTVEAFSTALERLLPSGKLLVAVSGGADSVAALRLALDARREVAAAHFDHRLRPESGEDADFVERLCAQLGVELFSGGADVGRVALERGWNLEDAARRLRYEFLHRSAKAAGAASIVVAHTRDDQAETFVMQLLRGAAFPSGMEERSGLVLRPLLAVSRTDLRSYLQDIGQDWREDRSNVDTSLTRAWTRHVLLPVMRERYPGVVDTLTTSAAVLGDAENALDALALQVAGEGPLSVANVADLPAALQRAALARLLRTAGAEPSFALIESVRAAVEQADAEDGRGPWRTSLGRDRFVRVAYGRVAVVGREEARLAEPQPFSSLEEWRKLRAELVGGPPGGDLPGGELPGGDWPGGDIHGGELPSDELVAELLREHPGGLVLRHRRAGDRVRLPAGGKSLSDLLIDRKVPAEERDALLVLAKIVADTDDGGRDDAGEVVWIEGQPPLPAPAASRRHLERADPRATASGPAAGVRTGQDQARLDSVGLDQVGLDQAGLDLAGLDQAGLDRHFMGLALERARGAAAAGELPVGAVVVRDGRVLAAAGNRTEAEADPSAHAELLALREAALVDGDWRLEGATLYVTLEPCPMCFGAVLQTRVARVVYGADNRREGALGSVMDLRAGRWKRRPAVERGVLAEQSGGLLRDFFAKRR